MAGTGNSSGSIGISITAGLPHPKAAILYEKPDMQVE